MKNPLKKNTGNVLIPVVVGAAAVAALTYLFLSDDAAELRSSLSDNLGKGWDSIKDKLPEEITAIKDKITDSFFAGNKAAHETVEDAQEVI